MTRRLGRGRRVRGELGQHIEGAPLMPSAAVVRCNRCGQDLAKATVAHFDRGRVTGIRYQPEPTVLGWLCTRCPRESATRMVQPEAEDELMRAWSDEIQQGQHAEWTAKRVIHAQ